VRNGPERREEDGNFFVAGLAVCLFAKDFSYQDNQEKRPATYRPSHSSWSEDMHLFFDVVGTQSVSYDFHGRVFSEQLEALGAAKLLALDLGSSETEKWVGSQVHVKDAGGQVLFSIPVELAT
jgi:uncharacterized protein DUF6894